MDSQGSDKRGEVLVAIMNDPTDFVLAQEKEKHWYRIPVDSTPKRWPPQWLAFYQTNEINDLYDESPLEDRLWAEFKRLQISAERQYYLQINNRNYCLDFALFCRNGKLDVETDGDMWHRLAERIAGDNQRNNDVTMAGWYVFRFNSAQINKALDDYCIPTVVDSIK